LHIFINMKKEIFEKIKIPKGVEVNLEGSTITIKGNEGENKRTFKTSNLVFEKKDDEIIVGCKKATKKEKKMIRTTKAHIENMIKGVGEKYEYKLKICFSHFPMTVDIQDNKATIKNFLGEKIPRRLKFPKGAEVKVEGSIITINSVDKEIAGQAAANFEAATKIRKKDRRVFQDGIFIINKAGKNIWKSNF